MKNYSNYCPIRESQRFQAENRALALIDRGPEPLFYHIMDISEKGLSFRYLGQKLKRSAVKVLDIYHNDELIVGSLPVKLVSDFYLRGKLVPVRRCSVRFASLTVEQLHKLQTFIITKAPLSIAP